MLVSTTAGYSLNHTSYLQGWQLIGNLDNNEYFYLKRNFNERNIDVDLSFCSSLITKNVAEKLISVKVNMPSLTDTKSTHPFLWAYYPLNASPEAAYL